MQSKIKHINAQKSKEETFKRCATEKRNEKHTVDRANLNEQDWKI